MAVKRLRAFDGPDLASPPSSTAGSAAGGEAAKRQTEAFSSLFDREIAILASIRHPNVVNFIGSCNTPPNVCLVTEFCARGSLDRLIHKSGELQLAK